MIDFLAANTDEKALALLEIPITNQLLIGAYIAKGEAVVMIPNWGENPQ